MPQGKQVTWTRQISSFAGTRWDCWTKFLQGQVSSITFDQFSNGALTHNPTLNPDHLFKADQTYLIPEEVPVGSYTWSRQLTGFSGSRWDCWTANIQNTVPGITWERFRDNALLYNPQLNADGRMFKPENGYLIPQNDTTPHLPRGNHRRAGRLQFHPRGAAGDPRASSRAGRLTPACPRKPAA